MTRKVKPVAFWCVLILEPKGWFSAPYCYQWLTKREALADLRQYRAAYTTREFRVAKFLEVTK